MVKRFVPTLLCDTVNDRVARGRDFVEPVSSAFNGICLVVDISGFTKLSGEYCLMGKAGIDQLQLATNGYMGRLVEIVYEYGGDIVKFAGDALICVFLNTVATRRRPNLLQRMTSSNSEFSDTNSLESSTCFDSKDAISYVTPSNVQSATPVTSATVFSALLCAEKLRTIQSANLSVHVGMSCGELCFGVLGGYQNRWECLVSGSCIQEVSACLDDAASMQVVMTRSCAEILIDVADPVYTDGLSATVEIITDKGPCGCRVIRLPSGNFRVDDPTSASGSRFSLPAPAQPLPSNASFLDNSVLPLLKQFVPLPIADNLITTRNLNYLAEIREVTTMFMKVWFYLPSALVSVADTVAFCAPLQWESYEAEGAHRDLLSLQPQFYEVQKVLHTTGAYLRQFLVDDKGCVLIACWGMPNLSYLDNAHRALSAAAQIRRKLLQMEMSCSFGITTGDVYCGTVGSALRMEYAAIGSVVNMSARLMCKAHGGILVDDATVQRLSTKDRHGLTALEPIKVKGRDEPLVVFSYVSSEAVEVQEKVLSDQAIPVAKREVMLRLLAAMLDKGDPFIPLRDTDSIDEMEMSYCCPLLWRTLESTPQRARTASLYSLQGSVCESPLSVLLIKGLDGAGKNSTVRWLRRKALDQGIPVCCTKTAATESQTNFLVWKRLFQALIPKDVFLNADVQRAYVHHLLHEVYPDANRAVRKTKFAVMRAVLGITSKFSRQKYGRGISGALWFSKDGGSPKAEVAPPLATASEVVVSVFSYLLSINTTLLVVENVENADEASLQVLCSLLKLQTRSAIVLTALKFAPRREPASPHRHAFRSQTVRQDALHSTMWTSKYKNIVQSHRYAHTLVVEPYTEADIERMVAEALNTHKAPAEILQLVQDYSGGTTFWVLEILQFIKEHGAERFLEAVSSEKTRSPSRTPSSSFKAENTARPPLPRISLALKPQSHDSEQPFRPRSWYVGPSFHLGCDAPSLHGVLLDKLVLCRFENLPLDAQHVLRTASIIGPGFTAAVLHAVLPPRLAKCLSDCLQTLVDHRWISPDTNDASTYYFVHSHTHRLIYELTPSSERNVTHRVVAEHIESSGGRECPLKYAILYAHYQQCDPAKALQYASKATDALVQVTTIFDFVDCLELLGGAVSCCRSEDDVALLQALISQAQIAIVMFCMAAELDKRHSTTLPHIPRTRWYSAWFSVKESQVVPAADHAAPSHGNDHSPDHKQDDCLIPMDGYGTALTASFASHCSGKMEEAQESTLGIVRVLDEDCTDHEQIVSEVERTKRAFLTQLRKLTGQLQVIKAKFSASQMF
jgi:class 3 adenylate cyclase